MRDYLEINDEFIDDIRLHYGTSEFNFEHIEKFDAIVPEKLEHQQLFSDNVIDDSIRNYYYLPTKRFLSEDEFQKMVSTGYCGEKDTALLPFSLIIFGAYYTRIGMYYKLRFCQKFSYTIEKKPITSFIDLVPYFVEYRRGFKIGFEDFDKDCVMPFLPLGWDKEDSKQRVFEFVTKQISFRHSWQNNHAGFTHNQDNEIDLNAAHEEGKQQGYFYRAWTIILSNNKIFAQLFTEEFNDRAAKKIDMNFENIEEFISHFKNEASKINLKSENIIIHNILEKYKNLLIISTEEAYNEVKKFSGEALTTCMNNLSNAYQNEHYKAKTNYTPDFLIHLKLYFEYKDLNNQSIHLLNNFQIKDVSNIKEINQTSKAFEAEQIPAKSELHNHIFKNNAFEVWQSMFDEFEINQHSRSDVKFMFEEMKKESLIHNTVSQKTFLEWITSTYDGLIIEKTSNHHRSLRRRQTYMRAKALYKE